MSVITIHESRWAVSLLAALPPLFVASCVTNDATRDLETQSVSQWHRTQIAVSGRSQASAISETTSASEPSESHPPSPKSRDDFVGQALERNPGIQASLAIANAKMERVAQVTSLPDPMLKAVARPEPIQTAAGDTYFTLAISQKLPLLERLTRSGNIAAAEARVAIERLNTERIDLIAQVEHTYWTLYRIDRLLEITNENQRILGDLERVIDTQYQVGRVPQQDLLRVQTELAKLRDDVNKLALRRTAIVATMRSLCDLPAGTTIPPTQQASSLQTASNVDHLLQLAANHNPKLAELRSQIEQNREKVEFANLGYWPDVTIGFEWNYLRGRDPFVPPVNTTTGKRPKYSKKSDVGDDNWAVMLEFNLPIWSRRIDSAKREATSTLLAAETELHDLQNALTQRIIETCSRVDAHQHTLRVLESELIPQSRQTYEVTLTSYQAGDAKFITLIDNWRRWLDFELMRHNETADLEIAYADLQREVGVKLLDDTGADAPQGN